MAQIYIAGPLYTSSERLLLEHIDAVCKQKSFTTYLPHRDAGLFIADESSTLPFFQRDRDELDNVLLVIAVLNGSDIDSGTSWEMGYAYGNDKPIIGFLDDIRVYEPLKQLNLMITNSVTNVVNNLEQLATALDSLRNNTSGVA